MTGNATSCCSSVPSRASAGKRPSAPSSPGSRRSLGATMVVTLGSLLADVPHTRPSPVTASASEGCGRAREPLGLQPSRLRGAYRHGRESSTMPAAGSEIPSVSLWAAVPHYVQLTPFSTGGEGSLRPAFAAARDPARHLRARGGRERVHPAGERGVSRPTRRDRRVRGRAREPRRGGRRRAPVR